MGAGTSAPGEIVQELKSRFYHWNGRNVTIAPPATVFNLNSFWDGINGSTKSNFSCPDNGKLKEVRYLPVVNTRTQDYVVELWESDNNVSFSKHADVITIPAGQTTIAKETALDITLTRGKFYKFRGYSLIAGSGSISTWMGFRIDFGTDPEMPSKIITPYRYFENPNSFTSLYFQLNINSSSTVLNNLRGGLALASQRLHTLNLWISKPASFGTWTIHIYKNGVSVWSQTLANVVNTLETYNPDITFTEDDDIAFRSVRSNGSQSSELRISTEWDELVE